MEQLDQTGGQDAYVISDEESSAEQLRLAILDALGSSLVRKRREAVTGRATLLIEENWLADEEFYIGYDDANRHEFVNTVNKPVSGGGTTEEERNIPVRGSTVFPNITAPYVDAAAARVGDMLLPTDDRNFAIESTPLPDMFEGLEKEMAKAGMGGQQQMPPQMPAPAAAPMPAPGAMPEAASMGVPGMPGAPAAVSPQQPAGQPAPAPQQMPEEVQVQVDGVVMSLTEARARFDKMKAEADRKALKAQTQVDDWLTECQYNGELRKVIDDCARIGSGVVKGPVPVKRVSQQWRKVDVPSGQPIYEMVRVEEIKPESRRVDPWDFFPDPACGENIHNGSYTFERDRISAKQLEDLIGSPGYIDDALRACLREGPSRMQEADARNMLSTAFQQREQFEIWYFYGNIKVEELMAAGCDCEGRPPEESLPAIMTIVNDRVVKAALNPLDNGEFPYDVIPWKRRPGIPWGLGVARQMRYPQRIVVAASRNLMDNAGLAAGPQIIFRYGMEPENGVWEIVPLKMWVEKEGSATPSAGAPVSAVLIPMLQNELMAIIQWGMKLAEDVTGLPMLLQGQGNGAPDTVGGLVLLDNNATAVLRRFARTFDSQLTMPHIQRYYAWLMLYGTDDDAKGDFQVKARGSSALVERDVQSQEMVNVVQLSTNPAFGKSPKKAMDEYLRSRRFDPKAFDFSEEEKQEMANQQPPEDPRITAAKIMAGSKEKDTQARIAGQQGAQQAELQFKAAEADKEREFEAAMAQMQAEFDQQVALFEANNDREMTSAELKAMLAQSVMKLRSQERLSMMTTAAGAPTQYAMTPPTEPAGRAPTGAGYQQ